MMIKYLFSSQPESWSQHQWCKLIKGSVEFTLQDCSSVGCLTESHSVGVDFALKWAGNRPKPYYSHMTSKRSGILLILCIPNDDWILKWLESVNEHLDFPIEFSFLKNRGYMLRKTLNSFCSFINQCLNQTHKNLPTRQWHRLWY